MEPQAIEGQAGSDLETETTGEAPGASEGQSVAPTQTISDGPGDGGEESFFDPKDVIGTPNEAAYKSMQGEFTKRLNTFNEGKGKMDAYDAFMANPELSMQQLAQQYGWSLIKGQPGAQENSGEGPEFKPNNWQEVEDHFFARFQDRFRQENEPLVNEVKNLKQQNVRTLLDRDYPDWETYQGEMSQNLQKYPNMVNDVDTLYRMSVPTKVLEQRAFKAAMAKIEGKTGHTEVGDNKTTSIPTTDKPTGPLSFEESVAYARKKVRAQGLAPPVGDAA